MPELSSRRWSESRPTGRFTRLVFLRNGQFTAVEAENGIHCSAALSFFQVFKSRVVRHGFQQPGGSIIGLVHNIAPPLVRDLMRQEHLGEEGIEFRIAQGNGALVFAQIGNAGKIDETWKSLPKVTIDGRDSQAVIGQSNPTICEVIEHAGCLGRQVATSRVGGVKFNAIRAMALQN